MKFLLALVLAYPALAQDPAAEWENHYNRAANEQSAEGKVRFLKDALKIADTWPRGDLRRLKTLVAIIQPCKEALSCDDEGYLERAVDERRAVPVQDLVYTEVLAGLADALNRHSRHNEAITVLTEARIIREKALGGSHRDVADLYARIGEIHQVNRQPTEARDAMNHALEVREKAGAGSSPEYARLIERSAQVYMNAKQAEASEKEYRRALALWESIARPNDGVLLAAYDRIADANSFRGSEALAESLYRKLIERSIQLQGRISPNTFQMTSQLGTFLRGRKRFAEAEAALKDAVAIAEKVRVSALAHRFALDTLARTQFEQGEWELAIDSGLKAVEIERQAAMRADYITLELRALIAECQLRVGQDDEAEQTLAQMRTVGIPKYAEAVADAADALSKVYESRGDFKNAAKKLEESISVIEGRGSSDILLIPRLNRLSTLYQRMGRLTDAQRIQLKTLAVMGKSVGESAKGGAWWIALIPIVIGLTPYVGSGVFGALFSWRARKVRRKIAPFFEDEIPRDLFGAPLAIVPPQKLGWQTAMRAESGTVFSMRVLNLLLSVLTLGVYSFWGKAKVRRYVLGQAEFWGDRFAFHGNGLELFYGWLRSLPALALIFLTPNVLPIVWEHKYSLFIAQGVAFVSLMILWPVARVGAYRYRLNRTSWRGIRFSYRGSAWRFLGWSGLTTFVSILTLGLAYAFMQNKQDRLLTEQTYFGNQKFEYSGRARDLFWAWLFALPLVVCSFGIAWPWWAALRARYSWANTTFQGSRFRCTATGEGLLGLWAGNFFLIVFTLGIGTTWAMLRTLRYWTRHVDIVGAPALEAVLQEERLAGTAGESFADFLGFDFGF